MTSIQVITLVTAMIGATCGICGTVLGIVNTWNQISQRKVRIKVVPKLAYMVGGNNVIVGVRCSGLQQQLASRGTPSRWCIEVINLSSFAVTISDVGFGKTEGTRHVIIRPEVSNKSWPARLESHEAVTLYAAIGESLAPAIMQEAVAYAKTDCGKVFYGTSSIFQEYIRYLTSVQNGGVHS